MKSHQNKSYSHLALATTLDVPHGALTVTYVHGPSEEREVTRRANVPVSYGASSHFRQLLFTPTGLGYTVEAGSRACLVACAARTPPLGESVAPTAALPFLHVVRVIWPIMLHRDRV